MSTLKSTHRLRLLAPLLSLALPLCTLAQTSPQPNPDSVRAQRARMVAQATKAYYERKFTHADTLRGTNGPERTWWDIQRYDITVKPDYPTKTTIGNDLITYKVVSETQPAMQLDLQAPLHIDSVIGNNGKRLDFTQEGNA